jgi:hypothetical protein
VGFNGDRAAPTSDRGDARDGHLRADPRLGDSSWYWHLLATELRERGHDVVAPDLPIEEEAAGLRQYTGYGRRRHR